MVQKTEYLTPEGLTKVREELEQLQTVRRAEVAERLQRAKELGGTEDNAEYEDAKNEQAFVEGRIMTLELTLRNAVVIEEHPASKVVQLGSRVTVADAEHHEETYIIGGSAEANASEGRISNESPVGRALLGHKKGDKVKVQAPAGTLTYTIVKVG
ncbi:MAG: transcription elongation factor GreA [Chloroflexi bacterium]|nr:transcription elongation factor GreA [Chloroflexota bacterium]